MRQIKLVGLTLLAVLGAYIWFRYVRQTQAFGMFEGADRDALSKAVLGYCATVFGVLVGSGYRCLKQLRETGVTVIDNPKAFVSQLLRSVDLWLGLFGSPIVYLLLLQSSPGMSLPALVTVAIENGFCCLIIVNGFLGQMDQQGARPQPSNHQ